MKNKGNNFSVVIGYDELRVFIDIFFISRQTR